MNAQSKIEAATLASAMAAAFGEIEAATKSANNPHFKSKYADLGAVIDALKPALIKHGLFFTQRPEPSEGGVTVSTVLHHASGESMELGTLFVPANKNDAQAFGSALTYARRYALVTAFGVPTEDDDGNAASRSRSVSAGGHSEERAVSPRQAIDDSQWAMLVQLIESSGSDTQKICTAHKVDSLRDLTPEQFASIRDVLSERLKKLASKEKANA